MKKFKIKQVYIDEKGNRISFTKYSKDCKAHGRISKTKYGCLVTDLLCNKFNCPAFKLGNKHKRKEKHSYPVSKRYRGII